MRALTARRALVALVLVLASGSLTVIGVRFLGGNVIGGDGSAAAAVTSRVLDAPVAPRPAQASTTTTGATVVLPSPINAPADPYAAEPEVQLGRLQVPAIGLDTTFYDGITLTSIDRGPSHWPGTAMPGELGNVVLAGHRVTHTKPFRRLDELRAGDQAIFTTARGTFTYEYVSTDIVDPSRTDIVNQTAAYTATFFACHPPGSARERIVVHWRLVGAPTPPAGGVITVTGGNP